jgi:hypothetical protein
MDQAYASQECYGTLPWNGTMSKAPLGDESNEKTEPIEGKQASNASSTLLKTDTTDTRNRELATHL